MVPPPISSRGRFGGIACGPGCGASAGVSGPLGRAQNRGGATSFPGLSPGLSVRMRGRNGCAYRGRGLFAVFLSQLGEVMQGPLQDDRPRTGTGWRSPSTGPRPSIALRALTGGRTCLQGGRTPLGALSEGQAGTWSRSRLMHGPVEGVLRRHMVGLRLF